MITAGNYRSVALSMAYIKAPKKGTPGVSVSIQLEEGPDKGSRIDWVGWMTEGTMVRTAESLGLMGFDGDNVDTKKEFIAVIEHEDYEKAGDEPGKPTGKRPRVAWINDPTGGGRLEMMNATEIAGAKDRLKAALAAAKAKAGKPAAKPEDEPRF